MSFRRLALILFCAIGCISLAVGGSGCAQAYKNSVGSVPEVYHRIYLTDFNTAWQSVLDALKSVQVQESNREGGFLQTKWTDNTVEKLFAERTAFMKAQYRLLVSVARTFYNGRPCVKISVQKEQVVQRDALEGWRRVEGDSVEENTLLYRIGRLIYMRTKLAQLEEEKNRKAIEQSGF